MHKKNLKDKFIFVLLSKKDKKRIQEEADRMGLSYSSFMLSSTLKEINSKQGGINDMKLNKQKKKNGNWKKSK